MSEIEIKNLTKNFEIKGDKVVALSNINLSIEKGDIFGIIGMSGAGKSTLVRTVNYIEKPTEGSVLIDGVDLSTLSEKDLRKKRREIGMIFQNFNLLEQKNVIDNICFPLEIAGVKKAENYSNESNCTLCFLCHSQQLRHLRREAIWRGVFLYEWQPSQS